MKGASPSAPANLIAGASANPHDVRYNVHGVRQGHPPESTPKDPAYLIGAQDARHRAEPLPVKLTPEAVRAIVHVVRVRRSRRFASRRLVYIWLLLIGVLIGVLVLARAELTGRGQPSPETRPIVDVSAPPGPSSAGDQPSREENERDREREWPDRPPPVPADPTARASTATGTATNGPGAAPALESPARSSAWSFRVGASAIATKVIGHEPVGTADHFSATQRALVCWTRIETDTLRHVPGDRRFVTHRWIHDGEPMQERTFTIGSSRYRVYSSLTKPEAGKWLVEIVDGEGRVIGTEGFLVE